MTKYIFLITATVLVIAIFVFVYKGNKKSDPINGLLGAKYSPSLLGRGLLYRYYVPVTETNKKYPLVVYLHGAGERGTDNQSQLNNSALVWVSSAVQKQHPSFVIIPQCPPNRKWTNTKEKGAPYLFFNQDEIPESKEMKMIRMLIKEFIEKYPVDTNRIYISGFSMGSSGTWDMITRYPDLFAAAIPVSGANDTTKADKITTMPIHIFHGAKDEICPPITSERMYSILHRLGSPCELTVFPDKEHVCTDEAFETPGLFDWLFAQDKSRR
jgi:predicted peptidase